MADTNFRKESGVGSYEYRITLSGLYDFVRDPDNLLDKAEERAYKYMEEENKNSKYNFEINITDDLLMNCYETEIKLAGYRGYFNTKFNVIVYFYDVQI